MVDGEVTGEDLIIPECVHTVSMEWFSSNDRVGTPYVYLTDYDVMYLYMSYPNGL